MAEAYEEALEWLRVNGEGFPSLSNAPTIAAYEQLEREGIAERVGPYTGNDGIARMRFVLAKPKKVVQFRPRQA
jgi:hypothetical protein